MATGKKIAVVCTGAVGGWSAPAPGAGGTAASALSSGSPAHFLRMFANVS